MKHTKARLGTTPARTTTGLRENMHKAREKALLDLIKSIELLNAQERTNVLAAVAEFYGLSLTVEN